jgi:hypothetical protein
LFANSNLKLSFEVPLAAGCEIVIALDATYALVSVAAGRGSPAKRRRGSRLR